MSAQPISVGFLSALQRWEPPTGTSAKGVSAAANEGVSAVSAKGTSAVATKSPGSTAPEPIGAASANENLAFPEDSAARRRDRSWMTPDGTTPRVAIEATSIEIDGGLFPAKAIQGRPFPISADIFADGHDKLGASILWRPVGTHDWSESIMVRGENDRWHGVVTFKDIGLHEVVLQGWIDPYASWRDEVIKKRDAARPISLELSEGVLILEEVLEQGRFENPDDEQKLRDMVRIAQAANGDENVFSLLMSSEAASLMQRCGVRRQLSHGPRTLAVRVERLVAQFGAWYELMPRSMSGDVNRHGTFDDVIARLPYVRDMGFDVLYFPPIHPIGTTNRKGRNNSLSAEEGDPGSPYAIGAQSGGHDAIHPELGSFADFERLLDACRDHGLEIALDFAIQCSPDHPWIRQHPKFFSWRPDGSMRFAENPPKKYEDIVNVDFYGKEQRALWQALRDIVAFWVEKGVRIFRVDNPHTKPLPFWQWMIADIQSSHPDVVFLSEAFTRPKMMRRLAKLGFTQSYTYFTWRNTKYELESYLRELKQDENRLVMRPNFFVNTPDINPVFLQEGGRAAHRIRLLLAATLAPSYGIYSGFELCEATPIHGKEEYLNSEKYEIRAWDWDREGNIRDEIRWVNELRNRFDVFRDLDSLEFFTAWNDQVLYFGRRSPSRDEYLLFAVSLDPFHEQVAHFEVPLWEFGLSDDALVEGEDLVTGARFQWQGKVQQMRLTPDERPYMAWRLFGPNRH